MPTKKKRNNQPNEEEAAAMELEEQQQSSSDSSGDEDDEDMADTYDGNEEIQVEFEGRNPVDSDFHGIRQLLQQLFLKAPINLSEFSDLIIGQNYIGSVVTQCEDDGNVEEDDDDDMDDEANTVFGITTAINMTQKADIGCVQDLRTHLLARAAKHANPDTQKQVQKILNNTDSNVGFLLNERFVNIPSQISVPLLENLAKEIKKANSKGMAYNFEYYVMLVKFYRSTQTKGKKNNQTTSDEYYSNAEEEVFCEASTCSFEYSVKGEADGSGSTSNGEALEQPDDDSGLVPYRKLVIFEAKKLPELIDSVKNLIVA